MNNDDIYQWYSISNVGLSHTAITIPGSTCPLNLEPQNQ